MLLFVWDEDKAVSNAEKHGITFQEAATAFGDPLSLTIADPDHSESEDRFVLIGETIWEHLVVVAHTELGDKIRIINARLATKQERRAYEKGK